MREFQTRRGLRVDGICGPDTWGALIESGWSLGDRLLYLRTRRCCAATTSTSCNAGSTRSASTPAGRTASSDRRPRPRSAQFQRERGIEPDGVCGPATINALMSVGTLAAGSVAVVRERESLRRDARRLRGRRLFLVVDPGLAALGAATRRRLDRRGRGGRDRHVGRRPLGARRPGERLRRRRLPRLRRAAPTSGPGAPTSRTRRSESEAASASRTASPSSSARCFPRSTSRRAARSGCCATRAWPRSCATCSRATSPAARRRSRPACPSSRSRSRAGIRSGHRAAARRVDPRRPAAPPLAVGLSRSGGGPR